MRPKERQRQKDTDTRVGPKDISDAPLSWVSARRSGGLSCFTARRPAGRRFTSTRHAHPSRRSAHRGERSPCEHRHRRRVARGRQHGLRRPNDVETGAAQQRAQLARARRLAAAGFAAALETQFGDVAVVIVLVTGAAGFIASKVCGLLLAEGHTVVGLDMVPAFDADGYLGRLGALGEGQAGPDGRLAEAV